MKKRNKIILIIIFWILAVAVLYSQEIILILKKYGYIVLPLGIACPITPSDIMTLSAACIKLNYKKCIAAIVTAGSPMIFLYGFLGMGFHEALIFKILAIIAITFVSYYTFLIWNNIKNL